ncbi:unnamed protein product [Lampetra planeri]
MALFPAFADASNDKVADSLKDIDWLNNKSFQTSDALSLHNHFLKKNSESFNSREPSEDGEQEDSHVPPRKKKKKKEKQKKNKKKKSRRSSDTSGSDSDTIFPTDLKRQQEADRTRAVSLGSRFCWLDDLQSPTVHKFCVDCKPDPANWTYKSLYRGDIVRYRRKGSSSLGLDPRRQKLSWEESNKKKKGEDKKAVAERYFSTVNCRLLRSEYPVPTIPTCPEKSDPPTFTSFLPLGDIKGECKADTVQASSVNPLGVYDSSTALWLQGKGQQDQTEHPKKDPETIVWTGRTEEFNRQLREQPANAQLWLKFIQYQDELSATVFGGDDEQQGRDLAEHRKSSYRAVLEKKLSIAERAVASNPSCRALQLERLRICKELWEPSALAKEWKKLVFLHPNSAPMWREYLLFTQTYFSNFTVSKVNSAYGKCLSTLSAVRDGSMVSHPALPGTEADMLDIFTQQCHFLRQSGHSEKAISLYQAMIDFTFYKPDSVQALSTKQQVEFFEPFWDSGEARVGELGARGWKAWMLQQERGGWLQPGPEEEVEEDDEDEEVKAQTRWAAWLNVESSREAAHWLPWRPDKTKGQSEEDCEDPDRQVLFDDIGPSLICLSSPELQLSLVLHFLSFLGLPVESMQYVHNCQPGVLLEDLSLITLDADPHHPLTSHNISCLGINSVGHMTTLQGARKMMGLGKQGERFITNIFNMIQLVLPAHQRAVLSLSWMQYEKLKVLRYLHGNKKRLSSQGKSSKQVAKRLLKEHDNRLSLALWREYAHLEWMLGNLNEARKVFSTAAAMGGTKVLSSPTKCELCLLWAQLEVEAESSARGEGRADTDASSALSILTRLAEGTTSSSSSSSSSLSPLSILKARRSYEQAVTAILKDVAEEKLGLRGLVGCFALFQYLTMGIEAASTVYSQARERMAEVHHLLAADVGVDSSPTTNHCVSRLAWECETLAVQQAALLKYHSSISVLPLATLRQMLTSALSTWPGSAPLWSIYIQVENRYHSAGRARRFFHSVIRNTSSIVPRFFAVVAEQQRKQLVDSAQRSCSDDSTLTVLPQNGLGNRIQGLFESATATVMGAHCPLLWRMYIYFLVSEGKVDKAKWLFYKALQNIPWVKGLYMDAVQLFPDQLQEFVDLMTEKEIRLRLPLEELDILLEE